MKNASLPLIIIPVLKTQIIFLFLQPSTSKLYWNCVPWYANLSKLIAKYSGIPGTRPNSSAKLSTQTTHLMREKFVEIWKQAKSDSPKLEFYHKIKTEFGPGPEQYLAFVGDPEARKSHTRLRISAHNLFVEHGRHEAASSHLMNEIVCIAQLILVVMKLKTSFMYL